MTKFSNTPLRPELQAAFDRAKAAYDAMTPAEQARMWELQRRSFVRGEIGFGSDADDLAYRAAYRHGDTEGLARLEAESQKRMADFDEQCPEAKP